MSQRLFAVNKIGIFLDTFSPAVEKRRGEVVNVVNCTFRVQPFDAKLAGAIDDGLSDNSGVRSALFKLNNPDPKPHIERLNFGLSCPRQQMIVFASPDTAESRIAFNQVKISGVYARTQKDAAGYVLVFHGTFGSVDRSELEYVMAWFRTQRFVTFEEAEEALEFHEDAPDTDDEHDEQDVPVIDGRDKSTRRKAPSAPPMFGDDDAAAAAPSAGKKVAADKNREIGHRYPKKAPTAAKRGKGKK